MRKKIIGRANTRKFVLPIKTDTPMVNFGTNVLFGNDIDGIDNISFFNSTGPKINISGNNPNNVSTDKDVLLDIFNNESYIDSSVLNHIFIKSPKTDLAIKLSQSNCWKAENTNSRCTLPSTFMSNSISEGKIRICKQFNNAANGSFLFGGFTSWSDLDLFYNTTAMDTVGAINWGVGGTGTLVGGASDLLSGFLTHLDYYIFELGYGGIGYYPYMKVFDLNGNELRYARAASPQTRVVNRAGFNWNTAYGLAAYADTSCSLWIESWQDDILVHKVMAVSGAGTLFYDIVTGSSLATYNTTEAGMWQKTDCCHHNFMYGCSLFSKSGSNDIRIPYNDSCTKVVSSTPSGYSLVADSVGFLKNKKWNRAETTLKVTRHSDLSTIIEVSGLSGSYINFNGIYYIQYTLVNNKPWYKKKNSNHQLVYNSTENIWKLQYAMTYWSVGYIADTTSPLGESTMDDPNGYGQVPTIHRYCIASGAANTSINDIYDYSGEYNNKPMYLSRTNNDRYLRWFDNYTNDSQVAFSCKFPKLNKVVLDFYTNVNTRPCFNNHHNLISNADYISISWTGTYWSFGYAGVNYSDSGYVELLRSNDDVSHPYKCKNWILSNNSEPTRVTPYMRRREIIGTGYYSNYKLNGIYRQHQLYDGKSYWYNGTSSTYTRFVNWYGGNVAWNQGINGGSVIHQSMNDTTDPHKAVFTGAGTGSLKITSGFDEIGSWKITNSDNSVIYAISKYDHDKQYGISCSEPYNVQAWNIPISIDPGKYINRNIINVTGLIGDNSIHNGEYYRYNDYFINKKTNSYLIKDALLCWTLYDMNGDRISESSVSGTDPVKIEYTNNMVVITGADSNARMETYVVTGCGIGFTSYNGTYMYQGLTQYDKKIFHNSITDDNRIWWYEFDCWNLGSYANGGYYASGIDDCSMPNNTELLLQGKNGGVGTPKISLVYSNNNDLYCVDFAEIFYNTDFSPKVLDRSKFNNRIIEGFMLVNDTETNLYVGNLMVFKNQVINKKAVILLSKANKYWSIKKDGNNNYVYTTSGTPALYSW